MHRLPNKALATAAVALAIFLLSTLSFGGNYFHAANPDWFRQHQLDSEQLVLDGLLRGETVQGRLPVLLGRYSRPGTVNQLAQSYALYDQKNRKGVFGEYHSQYGLQVKLFRWMADRGFSIWNLHWVVAGAMGLCLSAAYLLLRANGFSGLAAASFPVCLALSPWVIVFVRNLYWVEFTWFLPALVTAGWATALPASDRDNGIRPLHAWLFGAALFLAALIKFLCGYEYITTIYFAAVLSFVGLSFRKRVSWRLMVKRCIAITVVFALSFAAAMGLHVRQLEALGRPGLDTILITAFKRTSSSRAEQVAARACDDVDNPENNKACVSMYAQSLDSSPYSVAFRYLFVPDFLPWIHGQDNRPAEHDDQGRSALLTAAGEVKSLRFGSAIHTLASASPAAVFEALFKALSKRTLGALNHYGFLLFLAVYVVVFRASPAALVYLLALIAGSASWFLAAKAHSYIHTHMNYVLWYLILIPTCVLLLVDRLKTALTPAFRSRQPAR